MCGINGALVFGNSSFEVSERYVVQMRDIMAHRGPDGAGCWISPDRTIGLGFRRLSIIDLSVAADQPMCNEDETLWMVFNGEMYNHAAIRRELELTGRHRWATDHSDTEVILHAFEEWGIDCVSRFRGMFAIALWDTVRRELWLIRDRIGIKPLYYSLHHGRLVFASEIKALLEDPEQGRGINEEGLFDYLSFLTVPAPNTLFAGIKKLAPGTWLRIRQDGEIREQRYWDVWDHTQPLVGIPEEEIAERVLEELRTSVTLRKVSDVPVGVFLSGGLDSSTNAALFSEGEGEPVKTFSIGYDRDYAGYRNELDHARFMAGTIGAEHHERILTQQDMLDFLPRMIWLQDEPIGDPVCVPLYYLSQLAREHGVTVAQVGEGADELFWGYRSWRALLNLQRANNLPVPRAVKQLGLAAMRSTGREGTAPFALLQRGAEGVPIYQGLDSFTQMEKMPVLSPRLRRDFRARSSWDALAPLHDRFLARAWEPSPLHWMTYADLSLRLPELLLMRVDKMSMGVSLEGRVPFLDHKFVELALSIPQAMKTKNNTLKHTLKRAVRGVIPDEIIDRKKQGFNAPVADWFQGELGAVTRRELLNFCRETDLLDVAGVESLLARAGASHRAGTQAWYLTNLALWWKQYIACREPSPLTA